MVSDLSMYSYFISEFAADLGSYKSSWCWNVATRYDCCWIRLLFAQIMGVTAGGVFSNHSYHQNHSFSCITWYTNVLQFFIPYLLPQDLTSEPRYLATFTVGINQKANIDACVKKVGSFPLFDILTSRHKLFMVFSTVFRKLHYCPVSLWRPSNRVGWVWMVEDCYTH